MVKIQSDDYGTVNDATLKNAELAANIARQKIDQLYQADEPAAKAELSEIRQVGGKQLSKHQRFMEQLANSGRSLADIQTAWHEYYVALPDSEKHEVWKEFYSTQSKVTRQADINNPPDVQPRARQSKHLRAKGLTSVTELRHQLQLGGQRRQKLSIRHNVQSMAFGIGMGSLVVLFLLFGFFNERFLAPFISPSRNVSSTPIILDPNSTAAGPNPEIIIPKINVEIPVVYDQPSLDEKDIQKSLEGGVVHYASTPSPGEKGNIAVVGHSSNNILNHGKYKFAFVLLSRLENGDVFYLTKDSKRYAYRVYKKEIVDPGQVDVLGATDKTASATLITCDPPGTSIHRLVVVGEQISPDPSGNGTSTALKESQPTVLGGNSPSLWSRLVGWFTS